MWSCMALNSLRHGLSGKVIRRQSSFQVLHEADQGSSGRVSSGGERDLGQAEGGPRVQVISVPDLRNPLPYRGALPAAAAAAGGQLRSPVWDDAQVPGQEGHEEDVRWWGWWLCKLLWIDQEICKHLFILPTAKVAQSVKHPELRSKNVVQLSGVTLIPGHGIRHQ